MPMALMSAYAEVASSMPETPNCSWDFVLHLTGEGSLQFVFVRMATRHTRVKPEVAWC